MFVFIAFLMGGLMGMMVMSALVHGSRMAVARDRSGRVHRLNYPAPVSTARHFAPVMDARFTEQDWMN